MKFLDIGYLSEARIEHLMTWIKKMIEKDKAKMCLKTMQLLDEKGNVIFSKNELRELNLI